MQGTVIEVQPVHIQVLCSTSRVPGSRALLLKASARLAFILNALNEVPSCSICPFRGAQSTIVFSATMAHPVHYHFLLAVWH